MPERAERIARAAKLLWEAERPVRVLRTISWPPEVKEEFFGRGARELPKVSYPALDPGPTLALASEARALADGDGAVDRWLARQADAISAGARMLAGAGTPEFHRHSARLYGRPADPQPDGVSAAIDLARRVEETLDSMHAFDLGAPPPACHLASTLADRMREAVERHFGAKAPEVVVVDRLSANALASPRVIRVRRTACFTDRDVEQLIQHEALVHVATSLNGQAQSELPILGSGHPGTTRTQEGLAVFAELVTGTMDVDRLHRLADRVLAIQMAIDGADFLEVYRFFLEHTEEGQAYENARRVFRGGVLEGGAPFTKDVVYLDGLLRVHNFLRAVVAAGRADCLRLLFCGKLDLEDLPALCELSAMGLCKPPEFLPPWLSDLRFLVAYLAYSGFLDRVSVEATREHYGELLARAPVLD